GAGVTGRTLRNWKAAPAFRRERERPHKRAARQPASAPSRSAKAPASRDPVDTRHDRAGQPRPAAQPQHDRLPPPAAQRETTPEQAPAIEVEQAERDGPAVVGGEEQADVVEPLRSLSIVQHDGVPIFPDTLEGRTARRAYYEAP